MIGSPEVNKVLRRHLSPVLRAHDFQKVGARKSWSWQQSCTWIFFIRSVGSYFSGVTGWPPMSVVADLGIFFDFIPSRQPIRKDNLGRLLPMEYQCEIEFRSQLERNIDQESSIRKLSNPAERVRKDIWWIHPDGSNVEEVVIDISRSFVEQARPWFDRLSDLTVAFAALERSKDCYSKYRQAIYFAKHLGFEERFQMYSKLLQAEEQKLRTKGFLD